MNSTTVNILCTTSVNPSIINGDNYLQSFSLYTLRPLCPKITFYRHYHHLYKKLSERNLHTNQ